jgi:hypothetical protein
MFAKIPHVKKGERPSAEWANQLVDACNKFFGMRVGGGMSMLSLAGSTMIRGGLQISDLTLCKLTRNLQPLEVCQAQVASSISVTIPGTIPSGSNSYGSVTVTYDSSNLINVADCGFIDSGEQLASNTICVVVQFENCTDDVWFVVAASACEESQGEGS